MVEKTYRLVNEKQVILKNLVAVGVKVTATNNEISFITFDPDKTSRATVEGIIGKNIEEAKD